jgi:hypothetical protein
VLNYLQTMYIRYIWNINEFYVLDSDLISKMYHFIYINIQIFQNFKIIQNPNIFCFQAFWIGYTQPVVIITMTIIKYTIIK